MWRKRGKARNTRKAGRSSLARNTVENLFRESKAGKQEFHKRVVMNLHSHGLLQSPQASAHGLLVATIIYTCSVQCFEFCGLRNCSADVPPSLSHYCLEGECRGKDVKIGKCYGECLLGYGDDEVSCVGRRGGGENPWYA